MNTLSYAHPNAHRCEDQDCPSFGQITFRGHCGCHKSVEQVLTEHLAEAIELLRDLVAEFGIHEGGDDETLDELFPAERQVDAVAQAMRFLDKLEGKT